MSAAQKPFWSSNYFFSQSPIIAPVTTDIIDK